MSKQDAVELAALRELEQAVRQAHGSFSRKGVAQMDRRAWARMGRALSELDDVRRPSSYKRKNATAPNAGGIVSESHAERIAAAVRAERAHLAPGTPEKYPGTKVKVLLLDAEALLTEQDALREAVTALKPFYRETRQQVEGLTRKMPPELQTEYLTRFKRADEALAAIPTPNRKAS